MKLLPLILLLLAGCEPDERFTLRCVPVNQTSTIWSVLFRHDGQFVRQMDVKDAMLGDTIHVYAKNNELDIPVTARLDPWNGEFWRIAVTVKPPEAGRLFLAVAGDELLTIQTERLVVIPEAMGSTDCTVEPIMSKS